MYASDTDQNDSDRKGDMSNVTTDDELYNELMDAPPEFEDRLIPDQCKNENEGLEHLIKCLNHRFNAYPVIYMGTLKDAVKEAFNQKEIIERRPFLIYVNNDKSIGTNLFCKQLLCNEKIIEYLMNNHVLWAWDITFESNERKLNDMCKSVFPPWTIDKKFNTNSIDQCPLLIGIYRNSNGDYCFKYLIEGFTGKIDQNEFLNILIQFKEEFEQCEKQYEKAKEEAKQQMLLSLFQARDPYHYSKFQNDREFLRSMSMFPHESYDYNLHRRHEQFSRLLSENFESQNDQNEFLARQRLGQEDLLRTFQQLHMNSNDDADDEDDDQTPTIKPRSPLKFPDN